MHLHIILPLVEKVAEQDRHLFCNIYKGENTVHVHHIYLNISNYFTLKVYFLLYECSIYFRFVIYSIELLNII